MAAPATTRVIRLTGRPRGEPSPDLFELAEVELPEPAEGQVVVRNVWMSVDPYMRGRMNDVRSYVPPFEVGQPLDGHAVGEVVASRAEAVPEGTIVSHLLGWREHAVADAAHVDTVDPDGIELTAYLGVLGMPGLTAWAGIDRVLEVGADDVVWVNAAAGAVGSLAGQLAHRRGARVVGSAGGADKTAWLTEELGFDAAVDYRRADGDASALARLLKEAAGGALFTRVFDNVGGTHLEAAISRLDVHGRVAVCGAIEVYNATAPPAAPRNLTMVIGKRLRIEGFLVRDHRSARGDFLREVAPMVRAGELVHEATVVEGLERAPDAFLGLFRGDNTGKMVVRVGDDPG